MNKLLSILLMSVLVLSFVPVVNAINFPSGGNFHPVPLNASSRNTTTMSTADAIAFVKTIPVGQLPRVIRKLPTNTGPIPLPATTVNAPTAARDQLVASHIGPLSGAILPPEFRPNSGSGQSTNTTSGNSTNTTPEVPVSPTGTIDPSLVRPLGSSSNPEPQVNSSIPTISTIFNVTPQNNSRPQPDPVPSVVGLDLGPIPMPASANSSNVTNSSNSTRPPRNSSVDPLLDLGIFVRPIIRPGINFSRGNSTNSTNDTVTNSTDTNSTGTNSTNGTVDTGNPGSSNGGSNGGTGPSGGSGTIVRSGGSSAGSGNRDNLPLASGPATPNAPSTPSTGSNPNPAENTNSENGSVTQEGAGETSGITGLFPGIPAKLQNPYVAAGAIITLLVLVGGFYYFKK